MTDPRRSVLLALLLGAALAAQAELRLVRVLPETVHAVADARGRQLNFDLLLENPRPVPVSIDYVEIEAFDDAGVQCPRGVQGEISIRGPVVFRGYWNRPEATAEVLIDGWFRTGDIGRVDEEGFVYIEDRKKEMVLRGGENVYCAEVEAALYELEGVSEAVVFGVPSERLGEEVAAVIVTRPGADLDRDRVRAVLGEHLAAFKIPEHIELRTESLPRNAAGKFLKRAVRTEVVEALGRA